MTMQQPPLPPPEMAGWVMAGTEVTKRAIVAVSGREKCGKTHFACTFPGPIWYHNFDYGTEGVVEKFRNKGVEIYLSNYRAIDRTLSTDQQKVEAGQVFAQFQKMWDDGLQRGKGTIVIDTHSEEWEIRRLAAFGKLTQVMSHNYTEVNNIFRQAIRDAYECGMNVLLLQKMKKEYINNNFSGKYEPAGFADLPYLVQANVECFRDPNDNYKFKVYVKDCRQNMAMAGQVLEGVMATGSMFIEQVFAGI